MCAQLSRHQGQDTRAIFRNIVVPQHGSNFRAAGAWLASGLTDYICLHRAGAAAAFSAMMARSAFLAVIVIGIIAQVESAVRVRLFHGQSRILHRCCANTRVFWLDELRNKHELRRQGFVFASL